MAALVENTLGPELEKIVLGRLATGRVVIPGLPQVSARCMTVLRDPKVVTKKLAEIIETEPLLASMVLRNANAAANGAGGIRTLEQAISRIGHQQLKLVVVEYAAREMFKSDNAKIAEAYRKLWDHSVAVAVLARDIAALISGPDADACYLAGLLHDIGKPVVGALLLEAERQLGRKVPSWLDVGSWNAVVDSIHRKVGATLATTWKLGPEIASAIRDASDYEAGERRGIANVVRFANAIAKREGYAAGPVDAADVEAMIMVGQSMIGADQDVVDRLTAGLKARLPKTDG